MIPESKIFTGVSIIMGKTKATEQKKSFRTPLLIIILAVILIVAFIAGFFWYVNACRLFPDMGSIGENHFSEEDHCGLYSYGVIDDITGSSRTETEKLVLSGGSLTQQPVRINTTSFQTYGLLPCDQPVDVSLVFDQDSQLCCSELVYHYSDDEVGNFDVDMEAVTKAVKGRLRGNPLTAIYESLARALGTKQYNIIRNVTVDDTQLIVQEYYRTKAYD